MTPDEYLERAREHTGLSDFGPDGWQEGLEHMASAIETDIDDEDNVRRAEAIVVTRLVNRLRIERWYAEHGDEAAAHPVEGPLVVIGTGRSGTTTLHYLLALDPQFRYLRKWEIEDPVPAPDLSTESTDPRRPQSVHVSEHHIATIDGPTEDRRIQELIFRDDGRTLPIQSYTDWWRDADHSAEFPWHERILRLLHSHRPPHRWLLKSPDYLFTMPPFIEQYPDIKFVMTHRDPVKVIPSVCSVTVDGVRKRIPGWTHDPNTFGPELMNHLGEGVRRFMEVREKVGEAMFVDVGQPELQVDPVGMAQRVYDFAGLELTDDVRSTMTSWSEQNRAGSRGEHRYTLEEFGLTEDGIREVFAPYIERFGEYFVAPSAS